jgi:hypothetical protein
MERCLYKGCGVRCLQWREGEGPRSPSKSTPCHEGPPQNPKRKSAVLRITSARGFLGRPFANPDSPSHRPVRIGFRVYTEMTESSVIEVSHFSYSRLQLTETLSFLPMK